MSTLKLDRVHKKYPNGALAVKDISAEIEDGEFISLLGPSGCGKSTTLRMIAGLEAISSGSMYIGDKLINNLQPKERGIAMVFQTYALFPNMTVEANIGFGLKIKKVDPKIKREKIDWALDLLDLRGYEKRKPAQLSGGQRQRVALGRSLVLEPDVLLLDEPLSNLDAKLRIKMRTEIKRIHKKIKATTIYVTHDQEEAMTLSDRIIIMNKGEIVQIGTPSEIYNHPINRFVAGFIGNPPFNFIPGNVTKNGDHYSFKYANGIIELDSELNNRVEEVSNNGECEIAFRPEDGILVAEKNDKCISGITSVRETVGSEDHVAVEIGKTLITLSVSTTQEIPMDQTVHIQPKPNKLYIFERE